MKYLVITIALVAAHSISTPARADALMDAMRECMAVEKDKPDSTRGGASASEFCAAYAIIKTKS